ncbi:MAG: pyridoxamine 5'-phosphate oxidase family protein [Candidatus Omnitrophota bacterium]
MIILSPTLINFFEKQTFVIVSTIDSSGSINCAAKGIVMAQKQGKIYLIDLYKTNTFHNLQENHTISVTAVDEHLFMGYTLKGRARMVARDKIGAPLIKKWEARVVHRISKRLIKNVKDNRDSRHHPEVKFPYPQYLIEMSVEEVVDLTPAHLKQDFSRS